MLVSYPKATNGKAFRAASTRAAANTYGSHNIYFKALYSKDCRRKLKKWRQVHNISLCPVLHDK